MDGEDLINHETSPREAVNQRGVVVKIQSSVRDSKLILTFESDSGVWECEMSPSEAWLYASDIIEGSMKLDPGYIEELIKQSILKFQTGGY